MCRESFKARGETTNLHRELTVQERDSVDLLHVCFLWAGKAIEGTQWEVLKPALKGMNAWLFVHTEEIPAALKPYRDLQKELKLENNDFIGAVFEGRFFAPNEFKTLETMPTRAELYSKLLGTLKSPSSNLVSTLQGPSRNLVLTLKAYVKKLEEEA